LFDLIITDWALHKNVKLNQPFFNYKCLNNFVNFTGLFWRIHQMDLHQNAILFAVVTILTTWLIAYAYKNVKFLLKHKVAHKRAEAVTREVMKQISDDKKMTKKEKEERVLWKKNEVADYEATTFSIFYNNVSFLALVILSSFYVLSSFSPSINYVLSVTFSGGILVLHSRSSSR